MKKTAGRNRQKSLKTLITQTNLMIAVIPLLLLSFIGIFVSVRYLRSGITEKSELLIRSLSFEIDDFIHHSVEKLEYLAGDITIVGNKHRYQHNIERAVGQFESFTSIQVMGRDGRLIAVAPFDKNLIGNDMSRQTYFYPPDEFTGHRISSPFLVPGNQEPAFTISVSNGSYLVTGFVSLRKLTSITGKVRTGRNLYAAVFDENGYVIAHPNREYVTERANVKNAGFMEAAREGEGEMVTYVYRGQKKYGTLRIHPRTGWTLLVTRPKREALRPVYTLIIIYLTVLAGAAILAVLTSMYNRRKILPPFNQLVEAAKEIALENYHPQLPETTYREMNTVADAFSKMGKAIESRQKQIEKTTKRLATSLKEKEMLLKEIHHRVKNNMQVISSLLNLQSGRMLHPADVDLVKESQNRVYSMSLIHEQLYQSKNLAEIDFQSYTEELVSFLSEIYLSPEDRVDITVRAEGIYLGVDKAIPCGLIVNELVSNSFKYAFPGRPKQGRIQLTMNSGKGYLLTVEDSGIGLGEKLEDLKGRGLGYQLVEALSQQMMGDLEIESGEGLRITVTFP